MKDVSGNELKVGDWVISLGGHVAQIIEFDKDGELYVKSEFGPRWFSFKTRKISDEEAMIYLLEK